MDIAALVDARAAGRVGAHHQSGGDRVGELLLDDDPQTRPLEVGADGAQVPPVSGGHRDVRAGAVLGPPPAAADQAHHQQHGDRADDGGGPAAVAHHGGGLGFGGGVGDPHSRLRRGGQDGGERGRGHHGGLHGRQRRARLLPSGHVRPARCEVRGEGLGGPARQVEGVDGVYGPVRRVARGKSGDQVIDLPGDPRLGGRRQGHVVAHVVGGDLDGALTGPWNIAREHLVGHDAHGVDVRAGVGAPAPRDLGRDVGHRAQHVARGGLGRLGGGARQAEVRDPHRPLGGHQDVLRFDVAVDHADPVGRVEGLEDVAHVAQGLLDGEGPLRGQERAQVGALDELHDQEALARHDSLVVDGHDARVVDAGRRARLAPESGHEVLGLGQVRVHDLEGHEAVEALVAGHVDGRHAAAG